MAALPQTPLSREMIKDKLKIMLVSICNVDGISPEQIDDNEYIINQFGKLALDSLDALELAALIEKEFGYRFQGVASARTAFRSVNALADHLLEARP